VRTIFLQFENTEWERELAEFNNTDVEVPASLTLDGVTYPDVGVHFRGMSSFMLVPVGSKRSLNLSIDYTHKTQRLLGYRTLNLLNAHGDPTFLRPVLYTEIAKHYVPTPSANYVRVVINGEYWGVYVNAQQFNADFTRELFESTKGARWKVPGSPRGRGGMEYLGENVDAYRPIYEIKSDDDPAAWRSLIRMFRVLNQTTPDKLADALAPMLDVDGALKFLAVEMALANSDGYWARASDYNLYMDEGGRFHVIPHDVNEGLTDEIFGRGGPPTAGGRRGMPPAGGPVMFGRGPARADASLDPLVGLDDAAKPLRSKLLAVPALRARYLNYVRQIAERWLDWQRLEPVARRHHALIAEAVRADTRKLYTFQAFESGVSDGSESLKSFVLRRRAFLLQEK
jgi:spore coat protein CotH